MKKNHAGGGNGGASNVDATPLESATQNAAQGPRKKKNFRPRDVPHVVRNSDEPFLVVHKPAFWKCELPISESEPETLGGWLQKRGEEFRIANELFEISVNPAISGDTGFGALCHRLDRETSGPMIVAKTREAYDQLRVQFHRKTVVKAYMCLVHGRMGYDAHGPDGNVVAVSGIYRCITVYLLTRNDVNAFQVRSRTISGLFAAPCRHGPKSCRKSVLTPK